MQKKKEKGKCKKRENEFKYTVLFQKYAFEIAIPHENSTNFLELNTHLFNFSILPCCFLCSKRCHFRKLNFILTFPEERVYETFIGDRQNLLVLFRSR